MAQESAATMSIADTTEIVSRGWKNLNLKNVQEAVNDFQLACTQISKQSGETSFENADSLFGYGCALLELARIENDLLGKALQGIAEKAIGDASEQESPVDNTIHEDTFVEEDAATAEEKEKISDEVIEAMVGEKQEVQDQTSEKVEDDAVIEGEKKEKEVEPEEGEKKAADEVEDAGADNDDAAEEEGENAGADNDDAMDEEEGEEADKDDAAEDVEKETSEESAEVGNMQLAWEVLELSRTIYEREHKRLLEKLDGSDKQVAEIALKQADCYLKLGEIGVESETYDSAIEDFNRCKELLKVSSISADHRRNAEVSYQTGLAYGYKLAHELAIEHFKEAINVIETRIKNCEGIVDGSGNEEETQKIKSELESLSLLLPEIKNKVDDCTEELKTLKENTLKEEEECEVTIGFGDVQMEGDAVPTNVTHLIRKKRKPEEQVENDIKKVKIGDDSKENVVEESEAPVDQMAD